MTILITGSTGKTSSRLARQLVAQKHEVLIAGRSGKTVDNIPSVRFDWKDASTYPALFSHPQAQASPIRAAYLVAPEGSLDVLPVMQPLIEFLREKGVQRFVLLSATIAVPGDFYIGAVHRYLEGAGVEWAVVRPTWFMENFSDSGHKDTIRDESKIYSASAPGRVPFVSADDIAAVAAAALTREKSFDRDFLIVGPEALTYDEAAKLFSQTLGRDIEHVKQTADERRDLHVKHGLPVEIASVLGNLDAGHIAQGKEEISNDEVEQVTGHKPVTLKAFVEKNKQVWVK